MSHREAVLATVTALLDETLVRVGNEEYARANASFGLTTLRNRHVKIGRGAVRLVFTGKSGLSHDVTLRDRRLVRAVRNCHQLPGQLLFQYEEDDGGELHAVHSNDVNDYLRDAAGLDVTAKQFRTWRATVLAASELGPRPAPTRRTAANRITRSVVEFVAERLGNTPAVCRASYIHPGVVAAFEAGDLARWWEGAAPRRGGRLYADERRLLVVLRRLRRGERAAPRGGLTPTRRRATSTVWLRCSGSIAGKERPHQDVVERGERPLVAPAAFRGQGAVEVGAQ